MVLGVSIGAGEQSRRAVHGPVAGRGAKLVGDGVSAELQQHRDAYQEEQVLLRELQRASGARLLVQNYCIVLVVQRCCDLLTNGTCCTSCASFCFDTVLRPAPYLGCDSIQVLQLLALARAVVIVAVVVSCWLRG